MVGTKKNLSLFKSVSFIKIKRLLFHARHLSAQQQSAQQMSVTFAEQEIHLKKITQQWSARQTSGSAKVELAFVARQKSAQQSSNQH